MYFCFASPLTSGMTRTRASQTCSSHIHLRSFLPRVVGPGRGLVRRAQRMLSVRGHSVCSPAPPHIPRHRAGLPSTWVSPPRAPCAAAWRRLPRARCRPCRRLRRRWSGRSWSWWARAPAAS
eukprot:scaffold168347_cov31-Tisochrysis_lutea.AAC.2